MKIREDGQKLLKVPQTQHERRKTLRSMKHDTRSFFIPFIFSRYRQINLNEVLKGSKGDCRRGQGGYPMGPQSREYVKPLIIFLQIIYKREPNDPKHKNKLAYFWSGPRYGLLKKTMKQLLSYRVTLLPFRVYIAL